MTHPLPAARYVGHGAIDVVELVPEPPGSGEVRVDVAYTGICGTDLHILHGAMDAPGRDARGDRARDVRPGGRGRRRASTGWAVGDPVTVMPLRWCGECPACLRRPPARLPAVGLRRHRLAGLDAAVVDRPASILVRLPSVLSLRDAALVEPTAVAVHDVRRAGSVDGEHVLVVGGGPVGLLVAVVARESGGDVLLLEVDAQRRSIASSLGLRGRSTPARPMSRLAVDSWTGGAGAGVSFEVSGAQAGLDAAVEHARRPRPARAGRDPRAAASPSTCSGSSGAS